MVTQDKLKQVLDYNKHTGEFKWLGTHGKVKKGKTAGHMTTCGYKAISIFGRQLPATKLAWLFEYGEYPKEQITHINLIKTDNKILNLKKRSEKEFTQDELKKYFEYRKDGYLIWKFNKGTAKKGNIAGTEDKKTGYRNIKFQGKMCLAHRLIFLYHNGYLPENDTDHIDRNTRNNKIENLREVTRRCNLRNAKTAKTNTSGVKGVSLCKQTGKWAVSITVNGKHRNVGRHCSFDEAALHRLAAEQCLNWGSCDSTSSAYLYCLNNKLIQEVTCLA